MKNVKRILLVLLLVIIGVVAYNYPKLNMISGYAAKNMASSVFVADRTQTYTNQADNDVPLIKLAKTEANSSSKDAVSSVFGLMERQEICIRSTDIKTSVFLLFHQKISSL